MSSDSESDAPLDPATSRGSSVSSWMEDQYEDMIRFATVIPKNSEREKDGVQNDIQAVLDRLCQKKDDLQTEPEKLPKKAAVTDNPNTKYGIPPVYLNDQAKTATSKHPPRKPRNIVPKISDLRSDDDTLTEDEEVHKKLDLNTNGIPHIDTPEESEDFSDHYSLLYSANIDPDVGKMDTLLDRWTQDLKQNVLAEFSQSKIRVIELGKYQIQKNKDKLDTERSEIQNGVENLKEMLHSYETTTDRQERIITNLTLALQKQKEKHEMVKRFSDWRIQHNDAKRETFCSSLAYRHHQHVMKRKVWNRWHSILENKWQTRVERACQARASEVCVTLTNDYESKVASLNEELEISRAENERLKGERERYEEMMKKAFMRGVCALNLEAMSMFHSDTENESPRETEQVAAGGDPSEVNQFNVGSREFVTESQGVTAMAPQCTVVKHCGKSSPREVVNMEPPIKATTKPTRKPRVVSAKITAKVETGRKLQSGLDGYPSTNAPMGSVIVERHQPPSKPYTPATNTVQTVLSTMNNRPPSKPGSIVRKNISHAPLIPTKNIQPIKIVD